ncbi:MAG: GNAT family N-acetyltransferase [Caulobacteraceae bacterium]
MVKPPLMISSAAFALRPFRSEDAASLWEAVEETRADLQRWQGIGDKDGSIELLETRIATWEHSFGRRQRLQYAVVGDDNRVLGGCALEHIDWDALTFQLGYWLRKSASGYGYATDAARLLTRMAFQDLRGARVSIWTEAENTKSIGVAQRLSFTLEGRLRSERLNSLGKLQDTLVFACTNADQV